MFNKKINSKTMKSENARLILNMIRRNIKITRKELTALTSLTVGTITNLTQALIDENFVLESGVGQSLGGRKPIYLEINENAGFMVGLELETSKLTCIISDFKGILLAESTLSISPSAESDVIINNIIQIFNESVKKAEINHDNILGLGLAIPGPANYNEGILINPPNFPNLKNVPICAVLKEKLGIPVYVSKETSCAALSEYWFGDHSGCKRLFGISVGLIGIGGAFIVDGNVFQDDERESMDIGHTIVHLDGRKCSCGNEGCLEVHADGGAAVKNYFEITGKSISVEALINGANSGEKNCVESVKTCAFFLGIALGNIAALLSPEKFYFGGDFIEKCPLLFEKTVEYMNRKTYPAAVYETEKAKFTFGHLSGAAGGLALVYEAISKRIF